MTPVDFLWAIPVFGILVFIHELGHFGVAKSFGIRVHEFALGFGPTLVGFDWGETRYNLRLIPLGGFNRMAGMEDSDDDDPRGFNRKPIYARALVIAAGPIMNFVLAAVFFAGLLYYVGVEPSQAPVLGGVQQSCDVSATGAAETAGQLCPAYTAGLRKDDRVLSVNGTKVATWTDIRSAVIASDGKDVTFVVQRGKETKTVLMHPLPMMVEGQKVWMVGIQAKTQPEPLGQSLVRGPIMTYQVSVQWVQGLAEMIIGKIKPQLAGPVGITRTIAETASQGLSNLMFLTAFLSINLGMFNLLPIPGLDGSRLVFMLVEAVRGRRLDPQRENMVHFVGLLLLMGLMVVITYGEIIRH